MPIIEQLSSDSLFYVRKEAATAVGCLAQVVDQKVAEERLVCWIVHLILSSDH